MTHHLDQFAGVSAFVLVPVMVVSNSARLDIVLFGVLAVILFAWHLERSATP